MSERWINRVLLVAAFAVVLVLAMPALAQEAQEEPGETPMTEEEKAIEEALARQPFAGEITVTSRRREEALQEIPIAVSVVGWPSARRRRRVDHLASSRAMFPTCPSTRVATNRPR